MYYIQGAPSLNIFNSSNIDQVAIYDNEYNQVFKTANIIMADAGRPSSIFKHPTEKGFTFSDGKIIEQIQIETYFIIKAFDSFDVYQEILNAFENSDLLIVQLRAATYYDMIIADMPHREEVDGIDILKLTVKFVNAQVKNTIKTNDIQPKEAVDTSTVERGNVQPKVELSQNVSKDSKLYGWIFG